MALTALPQGPAPVETRHHRECRPDSSRFCEARPSGAAFPVASAPWPGIGFVQDFQESFKDGWTERVKVGPRSWNSCHAVVLVYVRYTLVSTIERHAGWWNSAHW